MITKANDSNTISGYITNDSNEVAVVTVNSIIVDGVKFKPRWTSEGLEIPSSYFNNNGRNVPYYIRIPRDEVVKMFKDIQEELSHE